MGAPKVTVKTPVQSVNAFLQPYKPATSVAKAQSYGQQMSVAPKTTQTAQPKVNTSLQSGAGVQYGNNPLNQPAPKQTTTPQNMNSWMTGVNALNARTSQFYNDSEAKRTQLAQKQYEDSLALQNEMYGNANNDLRAQVPILDERFGKFEQGVRANMAEADLIGATQKGNAQTYTGSAQRTAMENKRQTDAQREKQYAALGTIDSYGTGSFTQGNANADTAFNRDTAQRYDALSQNLTSIDSTIANAKREALSLIDQEKMKYEDSVRAINTQLRDNEVARKGAIQQAYYATQEAINNISDQYEGLRIAQEQQKLTFQQEMAKLTEQNTMPNVSDWFKQTGQPQTTEDFNFIYKKPEAATALQKILETSSASQTAKSSKGNVVGVIDNILNGDLAGIMGYDKYNPANKLPGSAAQQTQNYYDQLKSMLSLEGRTALKGSGQISDFEAKMLEKAASAGLGQNLSEEQARIILEQLKNDLSGGSSDSYGSGQTIRVKENATGQTGSISANEFDPSLYTRI
jgi:hypothetical protein